MDFNSYIGRQTRVVSKQNVRYSGTMQFIDPVAQKIRVTNVRCFGTEDRPADVFMPPLEHPFNLVEFNVSDLHDLTFEDVPPSTSAPPQTPPVAHPNAPIQTTPGTLQQPPPPQRSTQPTQATNFSAEKAKPAGGVHNATAPPVPPPPPQQTEQHNTSTAASHPSSSDTLQRAMDAMTLENAPAPRSNGVSPAPGAALVQPGSGNNPRSGHGRRGRGGGRTNGPHHQSRDHRQPQQVDNKLPAADFDFEANNRKFDKSEAARQHSLLTGVVTDGIAGPSDATQASTPGAPGGEGGTLLEEGRSKDTVKEKGGTLDNTVYNPSKSFFDNISSDAKSNAVYNPSKSFFDNISSDANSKKPEPRSPGERGRARTGGGEGGGGHGRGRGRGAHNRSKRDEEREKNVATFGEPGGVGLLGPGAYVGGYGGYRGRRRRGGQGGGGRGARGGGVVTRVNV